MDNTNIDTTLCSSIYSCSVGGLITFWMVIFMGYILFDLQQTGFLLNCWKKLLFTSNLTQQQQRGFYSTLPTNELTSIENENEQKEQIPSVHRQRTFNYPNALEYNYFDPDYIPDQLAPYSETIFTVAQQLCCSHGFQIDNSRNQAEHMLMLLFNETAKDDDMVSIPAQRLHIQMFANYRKWCIRMNVKSNLLKDISIMKSFECLMEDMLLFLMIWGESANLKHMPECLCFLLHKTLEDHVDLKNASGWKNGAEVTNQESVPITPASALRYPGFYLDMVVTPLYEVVAEALTSSGDHRQRKTYDDFNEFFWAPACLRYELHDQGKASQNLRVNSPPPQPRHHTSSSTTAGAGESERNPKPLLLSTALRSATKTYMEKRSWLHPLLSMNRVFEWHVITFTLLAAWAFSNTLQWTYAYTLQAGSFVFWEISFLGILWTALEVWTLFPGVRISEPSICGYLLRLSAGLLILTYQSIYYHWSFAAVDDANLDSITAFHDVRLAKSDEHEMQTFWWWQYIWLSLLSCSIYLLESVLCWIPGIVDALMTWDNDIVQAFLSVCYPLSQLYVAKTSKVTQREVFGYIFFWLTLLAFKLWFGYRYIVWPVSIPTVQLYDDYMNYYDGPEALSFIKTAVILFFWWFPHFLVYLIDLSIWYSVWASIVGGFIAIIDRQGAVREFPTFRSHFMRAPLAFCQSLMPAESDLHDSVLQSHMSTASLTGIDRTGKSTDLGLIQSSTNTMSAASVTQMRSIGANQQHRSKSTADIASIGTRRTYSTSTTTNTTEHSHQKTTTAEHMLDCLDIRSQRWVIFGRVWNEIIRKLWETDHISSAERDIYLFTYYDWLSKPIYLPLFQTTGCISIIAIAFKETSYEILNENDNKKKMLLLETYNKNLSIASQEALSEFTELLQFLIQKLFGIVHYKDFEKLFLIFTNWCETGEIFYRFNGNNIEKLLVHINKFIILLKNTLNKRKNKPIITTEYLINNKNNHNIHNNTNNNTTTTSNNSSNIKKSISTSFLSALGETHEKTEKNIKNHENNSIINKNKIKNYTNLTPLIQVNELIDNNRDNLREEIRIILNLIKNSLKIMKNKINNAAQDCIDRIIFIFSLENGFFWNDYYASLQLDNISNDNRIYNILTKLNGLLNLRITQIELKSLEAKRRLNFFINSLFMDIPTIQSMRFSKEYTCITPYYSEDILLSSNNLKEKNTDGVSTLLYLQTLYKLDWLNFLDRNEIKDERLIWSPKYIQELRIWASCRAQTLFRTVEGMMYTEASIRLLSDLEDCEHSDIEIYSKIKFNYVVACQIYATMKQNLDSKADDIEFLLQRHPNLRVAYVDQIRATKNNETTYYSVLIKHDQHTTTSTTSTTTNSKNKQISEIYRIKLPGNPILGEGKPENQNHALVFTRGRYLQAIDMNQDGYFEESLKMRNILEEFNSDCVILGFREHIFTGSVSSVANYMALQELSFVTLGQRVLNQPLRIRQHYGHPDLFKKLFVMTEGGMSKASRGINLSEDVFAGFNATLRGHSVGFKEYVQVGKGRDVGLQQTYKFEAKLSQGNAEQSLSRDLGRICNRLDFFRLMSFYYGGIGHYMANTMVMFTLFVVVYTMVALAVFNEEGVNGRPLHPEGVLQLLLAGMGILQTMPLLVTLTVEKGIWQALSDVGFMILSGGPLYFIFHIETKSYYFSQTLMAGGAMYRPTGRGFVTQHSSFDENFRFFATSHIFLGFELLIALIIFGLYTTSKQYSGLTWALWLTVASFLLGPFWFNPLSFEWNRIKDDYTRWTAWMAERGGSSEQAWEAWWKEETKFYSDLSLSWKIFLIIQRGTPWVLVAIGIAGSKFISSIEEQGRVLELLGVFAVFLFANWVIMKLERSWTYATRRFTTLIVWTATFGILTRLFIAHTQYIRYSISLYYLASAISFLLLLGGFNSQVSVMYKLHDYVVGHAIFLLLSVLALLQVFLSFL